MRITERDYEAFAEDQFPNMTLVRAWADCKIWTAGLNERLLVLADNATKRVSIFDYDTYAEREKDIARVLSLSDDEGGAASGIPTFITPVPPGRPAQSAHALPTEEKSGSNKQSYGAK